jgi:hypothetical protein
MLPIPNILISLMLYLLVHPPPTRALNTMANPSRVHLNSKIVNISSISIFGIIFDSVFAQIPLANAMASVTGMLLFFSLWIDLVWELTSRRCTCNTITLGRDNTGEGQHWGG